MKIAMIGTKGIPKAEGGVERHAEELSIRLAKRGHKVTVYCRPYSNPEKLKRYKGVDLRTIPSLNTKHLDAISHTFLASLDSFFQSFDVIHYHSVGPALLSFLPKLRFRRAKICGTVHALDKDREKWSRFAKTFLKIGERAAGIFPDETIVVSRELQKYYLERYGKKVHYLPNGVSSPKFQPLELMKSCYGLKEKDYFLFAGRLVPEKNCHLLVEAFKNIDTQMKLVVAGSSSHSDGYEKKLKNLAATDKRIIFTGHLSGKPLEELFSNAYGYVLPSSLEGLPVALLEALSYGLPVLCSDIPPNAEIVGRSENYGFLFRKGDKVSLKDRLGLFLNRPAEAQEKASRAKEHILNTYSWDQITQRTEEIYQLQTGVHRG